MEGAERQRQRQTGGQIGRKRERVNRNVLIWNKHKLTIFGNVSDAKIFIYSLNVNLQAT